MKEGIPNEEKSLKDKIFKNPTVRKVVLAGALTGVGGGAVAACGPGPGAVQEKPGIVKVEKQPAQHILTPEEFRAQAEQKEKENMAKRKEVQVEMRRIGQKLLKTLDALASESQARKEIIDQEPRVVDGHPVQVSYYHAIALDAFPGLKRNLQDTMKEAREKGFGYFDEETSSISFQLEHASGIMGFTSIEGLIRETRAQLRSWLTGQLK